VIALDCFVQRLQQAVDAVTGCARFISKMPWGL